MRFLALLLLVCSFSLFAQEYEAKPSVIQMDVGSKISIRAGERFTIHCGGKMQANPAQMFSLFCNCESEGYYGLTNLVLFRLDIQKGETKSVKKIETFSSMHECKVAAKSNPLCNQ